MAYENDNMDVENTDKSFENEGEFAPEFEASEVEEGIQEDIETSDKELSMDELIRLNSAVVEMTKNIGSDHDVLEGSRNIRDVAMENYLPYAVHTIVDRALPALDGLKPIHRRIIYTMQSNGNRAKGDRTKCANVVGTTMKLSPHGDGPIYLAMVRMTKSAEYLNCAYIDGKGNFGKSYSKSIAPAAPRYTEAKLSPIAESMLEGLNENAVDMVDNYDGTVKEPTILPASFPSVLVNTSPGIAVGMSSSIPSYNLKDVCEATIGLLDGKVTDAKSAYKYLKAPDFITGGNICGKDEDFIRLIESGRGSVVLTGDLQVVQTKGGGYSVDVRSIPFNTTVEAVITAVKELMKNELKEISDIRDETDINGLRIAIDVKRGNEPMEVVRKLLTLTPLCCKASFITRVIIDDVPVLLGVFELLKEWVSFRMTTLDRIYTYRREQAQREEYLLKSFEFIGDDLVNIPSKIKGITEEKAIQLVMFEYGLSDIQAKYVLDIRLKDFSSDNFAKKMDRLAKVRENIAEYTRVLHSEEAKKEIIKQELTKIAAEYGTERKTKIHGEMKLDLVAKEKREDTGSSYLVVTKDGYMKRLMNEKDYQYLARTYTEGGLKDMMAERYLIKNNSQILLFTYEGDVYKVNAYDIDSSRSEFRDYASVRAEGKEVMAILPAGDYTGSMHIVYSNGRAVKIWFDRFSGNRRKYINCYDYGDKDQMWCTTEESFFIITRDAKHYRANYVNILSSFRTGYGKSKFGAVRLKDGERILVIQPKSRIPDIDKIDTSRYVRPYTVKLVDKLW